MPVEFKHAQLENGLDVIAEVDPEAHTAAMGIYVKTGARDEATALMGVSHFLEHMMFKGTDRRTAEQVNSEFDDIGANHNAFTSHEMTAFYAHVLPEHLPAAEDILTDILRPALRSEDFDLEKGVILEEIAMYADHPFWVLYEEAMEHYYKSHPLRHRVLGTNESIANLTRDQMQQYFDARYSADNTVICYAGALDFDERVKAIEQHCSNWARTGATREHPAMTFEQDSFTQTSDKVNRHYLLGIAPGPSIQSDDRYAASILTQILGEPDGSRLYWALIDTGLADEAQAQYDGRDGVGEFYIYASCSPDAAAEVEQTVLKEVASFADTVTADDVERVRSKIATAVTLAGERPAGRMRRLGHLWTYTGGYRTLDEELERINAVTLDDLKRVAGEWPLMPVVTGRLSPNGA